MPRWPTKPAPAAADVTPATAAPCCADMDTLPVTPTQIATQAEVASMSADAFRVTYETALRIVRRAPKTARADLVRANAHILNR